MQQRGWYMIRFSRRKDQSRNGIQPIFRTDCSLDRDKSCPDIPASTELQYCSQFYWPRWHGSVSVRHVAVVHAEHFEFIWVPRSTHDLATAVTCVVMETSASRYWGRRQDPEQRRLERQTCCRSELGWSGSGILMRVSGTDDVPKNTTELRSWRGWAAIGWLSSMLTHRRRRHGLTVYSDKCGCTKRLGYNNLNLLFHDHCNQCAL